MYLYHFGLQQLPFGLTPNTKFYCELPSHQEAFNVLRLALQTGEGFIKIIGEVGTGKTLLCRKLLNYLEGKTAYAYLPNPYLSAQEIRFALAIELGVRVSKALDQYQLTEKINRKLIELNQQGKTVVLIVDEAQALPAEALEALRLFTNLETEQQKLLQVVLFAQPELDDRLNQKEFRQLRQRMAFSYRLSPLGLKDIKVYVEHRLKIAGYQMTTPFSQYCYRRLLKYSRGIPRLVNILCHKSFMLAFGRGAKTIDAKFIRMAAKDTDDIKTLNYSAWLLSFVALTSACSAFAYWGLA